MRPQESAPARIVAVSRLAQYLRGVLQNDKWLRNVGVRGEISNISPQRGGNVYFDLKDSDALLGCVVWSERAAELPTLQNGQQVIAYGEISAYAKASKYQLIAYRVEPDGIGRLHELYERLKRKLEEEGAFAQERKRPIPRYPFSLALVSSKDAAGAKDFLKILTERAPHITVTFVETPVQGISAAGEVVRAINRASRLDVDCVVVVRGGGSYEDLFAFNTEEVARALLRSPLPVIAAIGHETDHTIADFVADRRAETPSAAAIAVSPQTREELLQLIEARRARLHRCAMATITLGNTHFQRIVGRSAVSDPARIVGLRRQHLDRARESLRLRAHDVLRRRREVLAAFERRLDRVDPKIRLADREKTLAVARVRLGPAAQNRIRVASERLKLVVAELRGKDPEAILQQGYAIVRYEGRAVRDAAGVPEGATVSAKVARGTLHARVERTERDSEDG
ncbi:MAG: exodeoxyribonuclease VII large subunit [Vulcanimicrobiaceae bacterium]